jgi:hypothetical protein
LRWRRKDRLSGSSRSCAPCRTSRTSLTTAACAFRSTSARSLAAADLALALNAEGPGHFSDLDRLTIFADNLVPHVLRTDGVLVYQESLARRIDSGDLIVAASPEEIEIRACAVDAVERIVELLGRSERTATAVELDYLLWNRGQQPFYKSRSRHRTRTMFY